KNLIHSDTAFYWYIKSHNLGENIQAGRFLLNKTMTVSEIAEKLSNSQASESILTIQEGLLIRDIDQKLVELTLIEEGELLQAVKEFKDWQFYDFLDAKTLSTLALPLEGYLYPDTYFLDSNNFEAQDLIFLALDNFERKTKELLPQIKKHSIHEIITMASIIETEVFGEKDRKQVSGILWKRNDNGWMIGADATLLYITDDRKINYADLAIDSPYNTRKFAGLPPGPIANPSVESIEAAMFPTANPYWFYLTTLDTGKVIYSKTNDEHNSNRAKYLGKTLTSHFFEELMLGATKKFQWLNGKLFSKKNSTMSEPSSTQEMLFLKVKQNPPQQKHSI
ncbi:endolytic transglycosylase MltG, partial [Candidatus Gracilibacteria bacterium]|nr:endolytic transglycosylase MltG [Candidatus Gracilibacteria bacterium]